MKKILKNKFDFLILALVVLSFFIYSFSSFFVWLPNWHDFGHLIFNWPDANANYFFVNLFAKNNSLSFFEPLNLLTDNLLHTRSINVWQGNLVPMTFLLPLIIFGIFAKVFGSLAVLFLTPLLASISLYFFYQIIAKVFASENLAFVATVLLAFFAPWLFFANVVMLTNVFFIFCLLAFLYFFLVQQTKYSFVLSFLFFALALFSRPNELIWLFIFLLFIYFYQKEKITLKKISIFFAINLFFLVLVLVLNKLVYGGVFNFGYLNLQNKALSGELGNSHFSLFSFIKLLFLPFAWQTKVFLSSIYHYLFLLIWPYYILIFFALFSLRKKLFQKKEIWSKYLIFSLTISLLLLIYYANWDFADALVKNYNTISISYVRYFLPIYLLLLPFVAQGILFLSRVKKWKNFLTIFLVLLLTIFSLRLAFFAPNDGLLKNKENIDLYYQQFAKVKQIIPADAVIITERSDKIFFPEFKVVVPQGDLPLWPRIASLMEEREVFYFSDLSEQRILELNFQAKLFGLELVEMSKIDQNFKLFIVIKTKE
ncbi:glycosyltransferase family 39 protein [Candidatus Nomurabacteria bacterium]|nr:glycosyltransferase family 39 protein [Candidatus Nomurabacteria bacterium]